MKQYRRSFLFIQKLIAVVTLVSILSFTTYMGVIATVRASKNYEDLSYVSGEVADIGMIKHIEQGKFETRVEDVLVLRIYGTNEKFGFLQSSDAFRSLLGFNFGGKTVAIYYDPSGQQIEHNVTLHTYDLTVGQAKIIDLEGTKKENRIMAIFFFALTLFPLAMIGTSIKQSSKKRKQLHNEEQVKTSIPEF